MNTIKKSDIKQNLFTNAEVVCFDTVDSTSTEARRIVEKTGLSPLIVAADGQTNGRGRRGRSFFSPAGHGLYMSVAIPIAEENTVFLTCAAAVAVCLALKNTVSADCRIKWVNDIIYNNKKIAGILCERINGGVIIGVGINIDTKNFPDEIACLAGSLGTDCDKAVLCAAVADSLFYMAECPRAYMQQYRELSCIIGQQISFERNGIVKFGTAYSITDTGALCVMTDGESVELNSGEITIRQRTAEKKA